RGCIRVNLHVDQPQCSMLLFFFFFQAEDGIRDRTVTGVQTCALPILFARRSGADGQPPQRDDHLPRYGGQTELGLWPYRPPPYRSEERRVGKKCDSWWWQIHQKEKKYKHDTALKYTKYMKT